MIWHASGHQKASAEIRQCTKRRPRLLQKAELDAIERSHGLGDRLRHWTAAPYRRHALATGTIDRERMIKVERINKMFFTS